MMATQLGTMTQWQKSLSLDRHNVPPVFCKHLSIARPRDYTTHTLPPKTASFLHSCRLKHNLSETQKAFLNLLNNQPQNDVKNEEIMKSHDGEEQKKPHPKKISFKIKKTASIYRRGCTNPKMAISASSVAQLTSKFNELAQNKIGESKTTTVIKKTVNDTPGKVMRKPSVKTKPVLKTEDKVFTIQKRKSSLTKKLNENLSDSDKTCVRAKITYLETPQVIKKPEEVNKPERPSSIPLVTSPVETSSVTVKAAIEIFERRSSQTSPIAETPKEETKTVPKPKVPEKNFTLKSKDVKIRNSNVIVKIFEKTASEIDEKTEAINEELVQIIKIPPSLPQRRCDSMYETLNLRRVLPPPIKEAKSVEVISSSEILVQNNMQPNTSFLWRRSSQEKVAVTDYEIVSFDEKKVAPEVPPRPHKEVINKKKMPLPQEPEEKIYEELNIDKGIDTISHSYEYCTTGETKYEDLEKQDDNDYEYCSGATISPENIYETLPVQVPPLLPRRKEEPLPPRPPSRSSYCTIQNGENISNCYESIYNTNNQGAKKEDADSNYETIDNKPDNWSSGSNRDSLLSSDQQSNSLYGRSMTGWSEDLANTYSGKATSDLSSSDKSDDWQDLSENEAAEKSNSEIVIIREKQRNRKTGWSQKLREQRNKTQKKDILPGVDSDSDHHYESLYSTHEESQEDDFDSFDSDTESEKSFEKDDSGVDIMNTQLPEPPNNQTYVLTRLAATANKHMKRLKSNWSVTKIDFTKSLSRMTKRKSRTDLESADKIKEEPTQIEPVSLDQKPNSRLYQNVQFATQELNEQSETTNNDKSKSMTPKSLLNKFRRSMSLSPESANELTQNLGKPKSTFYLTETIDIDGEEKVEDTSRNDSGLPSSPVQKKTSRRGSTILRPQSPPPPIPVQNVELRKSTKKDKRTTSWYTECGLFKNQERRPNTYWYAEVGLYPTYPTSTPSTSSAENSGTNTTAGIVIQTTDLSTVNTVNESNTEEYYNLKNGNNYYNESVNSFESKDNKINWTFPITSEEIQLRLQDEPLYQFYDAAVLDSVYRDSSISDFDSDGYEEVGNRKEGENRLSSRPSAMELVAPDRNSLSITRTLWCEIPEVINSSVLSTLNVHQKKVQEAKFEMLTSEASYLNSLNVLTDHFIRNLRNCEYLTPEEKSILFSEVSAVKDCSEELLLDLEKCWQDNILLDDVCEIVLKHAEEKFDVYVSYCINQIHLDSTLKKLKARSNFNEVLRQLENSSTCQSLTLYSFLMLPMQRITRWPLLIDAVLKRLSPQDSEYVTCQRTLAALNKVVSQCNEGARKMEREVEIKKIASQLEFPKGVEPISLVTDSRWLVRSGALTQMTLRTDDTLLTFGKRFIKVPLHLFLFNDLLLVTKIKSDDIYVVLHYCARNLIELTSDDSLVSLPSKDAQGKNLLFLTILENQDQKMVEFLFSCNSESDKERWIEALTPPKSEDPDETLYECWDCPQVTAIHGYTADQPDELSLNRGDIINVDRKMADGWYHGERTRDGQIGWFPANYTKEVANPHVRARNLKQRYRLLAVSENYLKSK